MSKSLAKKKKSKAEEAVHNEQDELQNIIDQMIGEEYLIKLTGMTDLSQVERLELVVDTSVQSVFGLNEILPSLKYLSLDRSMIGSVRDLGSGLRNIISLSLAHCGLCDLDGIGVLTGLQEINLSDNNITDVAPLAMHESLQTLNVSGNKLTDISIGDALSSCLNLKSLILTRNAITRAPNYRIIMSSLIPSLEMLDGAPVNHAASRAKVTNSMILEAASSMRQLEEELDDDLRLENDILNSSDLGIKPSVSSPTRSSSVSNSSSNWKQTGVETNTGSELTHGSAVVLAGSMASAMRQRRNNGASSNRNSRDESALEALNSAPHLVNGSYESGGSHLYKEGDITALTLKLNTNNNDDFEYSELPEGQLSTKSSRPASSRPQQSPRVDSARNGGGGYGPGSSSSVSNGKFFQNFEESPSRPRTASSSKGVRLDVSALSGRGDEPRQMNSSRPQSAVSGGTLTARSAHDKLLGSFSIPFKVGTTTTSEVEEGGGSGRAEKRSSRPPSSGSAGSRHSRHSSRDFEMDEWDEAFTALGNGNVGGNGKAQKSIVHLDIVKRHTGTALSASKQHSASVTDLEGVESIPLDEEYSNAHHPDEDSSSDNENIAVTHAARHRLMSASASNSTASASRIRNQVLSQLFSSDKTGASSNDKSDVPITSRKPPIKPTSSSSSSHNASTTSSKAGKSLGFNLAGSLAAIDQWVHDMNSEDESDVITPKTSTTAAAAGGVARNGVSASESGELSSSASAGKILSRDVIINMCVGSTAKSNSHAATTTSTSSSRRAAMVDSDSDDNNSEVDQGDDDDEEDALPGRGRGALGGKAAATARIFLGDSQVPLNASSASSSLLNKANHIMNVPRTDPPPSPSGGRSRSRGSNGKPVKLKAPLPEFTSSTAKSVTPVRTDEPVTPSKSNGAFVVVEESSPPRFTAEPSGAAPVVNRANCGAGVLLPDADIVALLRRPPKETLELRTKGSFSAFFKGISAARMKSLLTQAYADAATIEDRDFKVGKRMELLVDTVP